jgi:hypothetical protein
VFVFIADHHCKKKKKPSGKRHLDFRKRKINKKIFSYDANSMSKWQDENMREGEADGKIKSKV